LVVPGLSNFPGRKEYVHFTILTAEFIKKHVPTENFDIKHSTFFDKIDTQKSIFTKVNKKKKIYI
jgi:hypothetical protein